MVNHRASLHVVFVLFCCGKIIKNFQIQKIIRNFYDYAVIHTIRRECRQGYRSTDKLKSTQYNIKRTCARLIRVISF